MVEAELASVDIFRLLELEWERADAGDRDSTQPCS
jgi:hypothetical protein